MVREQFSVIGVASCAGVRLAQLLGIGFINELAAQLDAIRAQIADGDDAIVAAGNARELQHSRHVMDTRDAADADGADVNAIRGCSSAENRVGNDGRKSGGNRSGE